MKTTLRIACCVLLLFAGITSNAAIRYLPGFSANVYGANDDGTWPCIGMDTGTPITCAGNLLIPIGFTLNFYGANFNSCYLNNNGNVTFDNPLSEFTPFGLVATATQIIAPFFADVDTRQGNVVTFGNDVVDGHQAFGVNWVDVGYFNMNVDKLNSFQLILIERSDRNPGDFDIEFNYDQVQWETGDASDGAFGLGGSSAVVGFSNGSGLPGTSFQLNGSAIPGQLLDSNPGGLSYRLLNSTVPGRLVFPIVNLTNTVLNVTRFSQGDSRWGSNLYGNSNYTIQQKGCALSTLAMALNFEGVSTDPGALNTLMKNHDDFVGTSVDWTAAARDASNGTLEFHPYRTSDLQYLSEQIREGHPVIVGVNLNSGGTPSHFVLVTGYQNGRFLINDPGHASRTTLTDYNNNFETRGYVSDPPGDLSGLSIMVDDPAAIFAVDPSGRRIGLVSGTTLEEAPQAFYFVDQIEDSDLTGAAGNDTSHQISIYQPQQGSYQLFLMGNRVGNYKLKLRPFSTSGSAGAPMTLTGTIRPGAVQATQVLLGATGVTPQTYTNLCPWTATPTNGSLPLDVMFSGPSVDAHGHSLVAWHWTFGDGATSIEQFPVHTYATPAIYYPVLSALSSAGETVVGMGPSITLPAVQFTATPNGGAPPLTVQFTSAAVDNLGSAIVRWNWNFGDGATSTLQNPSHTYVTAGSFTPILFATNSLGLTVGGVGPRILAIPSSGLVLNGSFETGDLTAWTESGNIGGADVSTDPYYAHSGTYGLEMGPSGALGYISQTLHTVPGEIYLVSLWFDSPDGEVPNEFTIKWNGTNLFDWVDAPAVGWTNLHLYATAASANTVLQIGFEDDPSYLGLDDIAVTPIQPSIVKIRVSGQDLVLRVKNGIGGRTYRILSSANAAQPRNQWTLVQSVVPNQDGEFEVTLTNAIGPGPGQKFYTVLLP